MDFSIIAEIFEDMEKTKSRLLLIDHLVDLLKKTPNNTIKKIVYLLQGKIYPSFEGIELGLAEKLTIKAISESTGITVKEVEEIYGKIGDLGEAAREITKNKYQRTLFNEKITVERVYSTFEKIAQSIGTKSQVTKLRLVNSLLNDATPLESKYIIKFLLGTLRLGIAEYTIIDALAIAFTGNRINRKKIEEKYNIYSDLGRIAEILSVKGLKGVDELKITPLKPIRPMLAERITDPREALKRSNDMIALEYKLDGERVQIHKDRSEVQLFSRSLEKITTHYPDIVDSIINFKVNRSILEAEIVSIDLTTKEIQPFQELMHRKRKYNIHDIVKKYPIKVYLFDILYLEGKDLTNYEYIKRRKILETIVKENKNNTLEVVQQIVSSNLLQIENFFSQAKLNGCEGLMLKQLNSKYRAGAREYLWMKLKKEYDNALGDSFDLTVIGALLGRGKRTGYYGALLLASYDPDSDTFQSICKVGTGFSDQDLELIYNDLKNYIVKEKHSTVRTNMKMDVWFKPKLVLEIIGSEITLSPSHTAAFGLIRDNFGLALRFPKYSGKIRYDKNPEDSTNTDELIKLYKKQVKSNKS
ncbi:MAG TPA: ATP-dependent DNA ligase [Nitrososphaeraceae archaeon]|nr:ATP-dependent DNA ligase [Nitrososphaeraceae archaeon]